MTSPSRLLLFTWLCFSRLADHGSHGQTTCFQTKQELMDAIQAYIDDSSSASAVAAKYGHPIGSWCVSPITDMAGLFASQQAFDADTLDGWDTSSVTTMERMFERCNNFRGTISSWDVSKVVSFSGMFQQATRFAGDLSKWNTASATDMSFMFYDATSIQTDLSQWKVSKVVNFESFSSASTSLNTDLSAWDVMACTNFKDMFARGAGLSKNLCTWGSKVQWTANMDNMFGISDTTSSRCPDPRDPLPDTSPPGPFCYSCDPNANPDGTPPGTETATASAAGAAGQGDGGGGGGTAYVANNSNASRRASDFPWCCLFTAIVPGLLFLWVY